MADEQARVTKRRWGRSGGGISSSCCQCKSGAGRQGERSHRIPSVTGNTEKMAQGVTEGARGVPGTNVVLKGVGEVAADDLLSSDAVIVGSPVYFGNMSGEVRTFF